LAVEEIDLILFVVIKSLVGEVDLGAFQLVLSHLAHNIAELKVVDEVVVY